MHTLIAKADSCGSFYTIIVPFEMATNIQIIYNNFKILICSQENYSDNQIG
ncbi:MAG: hypothetical protein R6U68_02540 [Desulfobacteraceae bacterium]